MAKAIKVINAYGVVLTIVDSTTKALKVVEKDSQCSLSEDVKLHSVNADLKQGKAYVMNCQGGLYSLEVIEGDTAYIRTEKQYLNAMKVAALFA